MPSRKRKHSISDESASASDADYQESRRAPSVKKRRYDLARNLSQLSLFQQASETPQSQLPSMFQSSALPYDIPNSDVKISEWSGESPANAPMDADGEAPMIDTMRFMVEEPADAPDSIPEVRMHNTSSYELEKDRIVITDLDSSEDEAETSSDIPSAGSDAQYSVSPAFLSRLKSCKFAAPLINPPSSPVDPSRALVLFKPSPWIAKTPRELEGIYHARDMEQEKDNRELVVTEVTSAYPDAMEIE